MKRLRSETEVGWEGGMRRGGGGVRTESDDWLVSQAREWLRWGAGRGGGHGEFGVVECVGLARCGMVEWEWGVWEGGDREERQRGSRGGG